MSALQDSIEGLYQAFKNVHAPQHLDGCPCCTNEVELAKLAMTPRRAISAEALGYYASRAMTTIGGVDHFLYFLPRILEVTALDDGWWPDIEVTASRIRDCKLNSWPTERREALSRFLEEVVRSILASTEYYRIDEWLCAIARMDFDAGPFLAQIETNRAAVLQYFEDNAESLRQDKLCNPFWELPNVGHDAIVRWFKSDKIRKIAFEAYGYDN